MKVGESQTLKVVFTPLDTADTTITWTSSNKSVATISKYGYLEALKPGKTTIKAVSQSGNIDKIEITVLPLEIEYLYVFAYQTTFVVGYTGSIGQITLIPETITYNDLVFSSSNEEVIKVFNDVTMEAVGAGNAIITVSSLDGKKSYSVEFVVTNVNANSIEIDSFIDLSIKDTITLNPVILPDNTTNKNLKYEVFNQEILTVDQEGLVRPIKVGTTYVKISCGDIYSEVYINVLPVDIISISSDEQFIEIYQGEEKKVNLNVNPVDATYQKLLYTSSNPQAVRVINGVIKGIESGTSTITITSLNGISYNIYVYVKAKELEINNVNFSDITIKENNSYKLDVKEEYLGLITFDCESDKYIIIANNKIYALNQGIEEEKVIYNNQVIDTFNVIVENNGCNSSNQFVTIVLSFIAMTKIFALVFRRK